jgi:hypothetical protein
METNCPNNARTLALPCLQKPVREWRWRNRLLVDRRRHILVEQLEV